MAGASSYITVSQLIQEALGHLGVYAPGDALQAGDVNSALFTLQAIVDGYGAQSLTKFNRDVLGSFSTVAGQQSYTVGVAGSGANWVVPFLPAKFDLITFSIGTVEYPIYIDDAAQWASIGIKSITTNFLTECWPNYSTTAHTLNFYPLPNQSVPVTLYLLQQVAQLNSLSTLIQLPPQYQELLTFELAIKCSSKFGAVLPSWLPTAWQDAQANVKASNFEPLDVACDPAIVKPGPRTGGGSINFYLGR